MKLRDGAIVRLTLGLQENEPSARSGVRAPQGHPAARVGHGLERHRQLAVAADPRKAEHRRLDAARRADPRTCSDMPRSFPRRTGGDRGRRRVLAQT